MKKITYKNKDTEKGWKYSYSVEGTGIEHVSALKIDIYLDVRK
jgi:hypothetical protein